MFLARVARVCSGKRHDFMYNFHMRLTIKSFNLFCSIKQKKNIHHKIINSGLRVEIEI